MPTTPSPDMATMIQSYNTIMLLMMTMYNRQQTPPTPPSSSLQSLLQTLLQTSSSRLAATAGTGLAAATAGTSFETEGEGDGEEAVISFMFDVPRPTTARPTTTSLRRLTQQQILNNTRIFVYSDNEPLSNPTCPISHTDFITGDIVCEIKNCHHVFQYAEIMKWLDINTTCPVCRAAIHNSIQG